MALQLDIKRLTDFRAAYFCHGGTETQRKRFLLFSVPASVASFYLPGNIEMWTLFKGDSLMPAPLFYPLNLATIQRTSSAS